MKVVVIVPQEKFNNNEFNTLIKELNENGINYHVASVTKDMAYGYLVKSGNGSKPLSVKPDLTISQIKIMDYKGIILIGGSGNKKYLWKNESLHHKLKLAKKNNILIAAICLSPICLIYSGIVKSTGITSYPTKETLDIILKSNNEYIKENVVISDGIITANGPKASLFFAKAIVKYLKRVRNI